MLCALGLAALDAVLLALLSRTDETLSDTAHGLPLGTALPTFAATAVDGSSVTERHAFGKLVLFLGTRCNPCLALARELQGAELADRAALLVIVADRGDEPDDANLLSELAFMPPAQVVHDRTRALTERLAMPGVAFAYGVDRRGSIRAKRTVRSLAVMRRVLRLRSLHR